MTAYGTDPSPTTAPPDGKPRSPRRRVVLSGTFQSYSGSFRVAVRNISCTGAAIVCDQPLRIEADGVLVAATLDCLCRVVWARGSFYGLEFDEPLTQACVIELHRVTEQEVKQAERVAARTWFEEQAR